VGELAGGDRNAAPAAGAVPDLRGVDVVPARPRLVEDPREITVERRHRRPLATKSLELGMMRVTACLAAEHGAREQPFAPERDEPAGVEVTRMERPEPHVPIMKPDRRHALTSFSLRRPRYPL
jgi:hypothetical protein